MRIATVDGAIRRAGGADGGAEEIRCPSCSRLLVLRAGPAVTPHFAHRPRQACRNRPAGRPKASPLRVEQLTLFEVDAHPSPIEAPVPRRRRRRAWLPRLIRWLKGGA